MKKTILALVMLAMGINFSFAKDLVEIDNQNYPEEELFVPIPNINRVSNSDLQVSLPNYLFSNTTVKIQVKFVDPNHVKLKENDGKLGFIVNGEYVEVKFDQAGIGFIQHAIGSNDKLNIYFEDFKYESKLNVIPVYYVILPVVLLLSVIGYKLYRNKLNNDKKAEKEENGAEILKTENKKDLVNS